MSLGFDFTLFLCCFTSLRFKLLLLLLAYMLVWEHGIRQKIKRQKVKIQFKRQKINRQKIERQKLLLLLFYIIKASQPR